MTDQERKEKETTQGEATQGDLADELRVLGENIKNFVRALWESQERKRVQQDIETGLAGLGASIGQAANEFQQSQTGQRMKEEFEEIGERIRSGEMETALRNDFLGALRTANLELEKALNKMSTPKETQAGSETEPKA